MCMPCHQEIIALCRQRLHVSRLMFQIYDGLRLIKFFDQFGR